MLETRRIASFLAAVLILYICTSCTMWDDNIKKTLDEKGQQQVNAADYDKKRDTRYKKPKRITVGVSMQGFDSPYVLSVKKYFEEIIKERTDIDAIILDGQSNPEKQVSQIENFISRKVDVIILNPISYDGCAPAVEAANKANIPIITLITQVINQEKCASFVGSDHKESGIIEAKMMANYLNGKGKIVILEGVMGIDAQLRRLAGYKDILSGFPDIEVIGMQTAAWQRIEAYAIVENWILTGKKFNAVLSENDNMAMGALRAIEEAGLQNEIKVFGIDGDDDALQAVKDGRLEGTVFQDARSQAEKAVECAVRLSKGGVVEDKYVIPFRPVNKDNVSSFIKK